MAKTPAAVREADNQNLDFSGQLVPDSAQTPKQPRKVDFHDQTIVPVLSCACQKKALSSIMPTMTDSSIRHSYLYSYTVPLSEVGVVVNS